MIATTLRLHGGLGDQPNGLGRSPAAACLLAGWLRWLQRSLGLVPGQCVVVEDSISGIQAADAAGIGCLIALGPAPTHGTLARLEGVSQMVEDLGQVPKERLFLP